MKIADIHSVVLLGIGGIGMSALARYYNHIGKAVYGYDKTPSAITQSLADEGVNITFNDDTDWFNNLTKGISQDKVLVIYTPAIPINLQLKKHTDSEGYTVVKRSVALGEVTKHTKNLSIAGTHGKTTTSCLLAHILKSSKVPSVAFLGGISSNFNSNYNNDLTSDSEAISITEADEFDRSFLQLHPYLAAITSMDADHLDIYGNEDELVSSFKAFAKQVLPGGTLFVHHSLQHHFPDQDIVTYGINYGQVSAQHVHIADGNYVFDLYWNNQVFKNLTLGIAGKHNVENAVVASAIALELGISEDQLRTALISFTGVKRRFEYIVKSDVVYIDDYAHHPTELKATISSARQLYPTKKITGIFQPHLYSRTRDFVDGFAESLSLLDDVWLMDIYPARELPIPGITSEIILDKISSPKRLVTPKEILDNIKENCPEVLLTLGAGDIDRLVTPIKQVLTEA